MMKDYYQQYMKALQLAGMSQRTQETYTLLTFTMSYRAAQSPKRITSGILPVWTSYYL